MKTRTFLKTLLGLLAIPVVGRESRMERNLRARDEALNTMQSGQTFAFWADLESGKMYRRNGERWQEI